MVAQVCWELLNCFFGVRPDCFKVMPDHVQRIIENESEDDGGVMVGATLCGCPEPGQWSVSADITGDTVEYRVSLPNVAARY